ncbi:MAG: hypothetical protein ACRERV_04485 [Methylococcales bacterium]
MARFPKTESKILTPGQDIAAGFSAHTDVFAASPIEPDAFRQFIAASLSSINPLSLHGYRSLS